jgi:hypothetical protein
VSGPWLRAWRLAPSDQQRLALAGELAGRPSLLVAAADQRARLASTALVWRRLRQEARAGLAVLLWSTDPEELLAPADRVGVMAGGRVVADLDPTCLSATDLVRALADPVAFEKPDDPSPWRAQGPGRCAGDGPRVACLGRRRSRPLARLAWVLVLPCSKPGGVRQP